MRHATEKAQRITLHDEKHQGLLSRGLHTIDLAEIEALKRERAEIEAMPNVYRCLACREDFELGSDPALQVGACSIVWLKAEGSAWEFSGSPSEVMNLVWCPRCAAGLGVSDYIKMR